MDFPELNSNSKEYKEFLELQESNLLISNQLFVYYLNDIYNELFFRIPNEIITEDKKSIVPTGITELVFSQYLDFQFFICEKLFKSFDKKKEGFLNKQDFINGLFNLYVGTFKERVEVIFSIFDFNKDGIINKEDIKLLLSYIPEKENEYKKQIQILKDLDKILDETFEKGKNKMEFEEYFYSIQNKKPETFLRLIIYFYKNKPFDIETINSYKYMKKKPLLKNQIKIQSKTLLLSPKKMNFPNQRNFQTFQKIKKNEENENTNKTNRQLYRHSSIKNLPIPVELFKMKKGSSSTTNIFLRKNEKTKTVIRKNSTNNDNKMINNNQSSFNIIDKNQGKKNILLQKGLKSRKSIDGSNINLNKGNSTILPLLNHSQSLINNSLNPKLMRTKYKLSPVSKVNKFSPQTINIHNLENDFDEPPQFCLCENIDDFKLEIEEDEKNDFDDSENEKNNNNINDLNNNYSKKVESFKKFKSTLPKLNLYFEDYLFKYDDSKISILKRYFCVLKDFDLLFFSSNLKNELILISNIKGAYIKKGENITVAKETYYTITIIYSNNKKKSIYFLSDIKRNKWLQKLKENIKNYDFNEFYILKEQIGEGYFGKVQKAINKETKKEYAVKVINKSKLSLKNYKLIKHETNIMKLLHHPHIVSLEDYFEDDEYIYIIMELLSGGDLLEFVGNKEEYLSEKTAAKIIKEISKGIKYMNLFGLIHRDLKPENIVLSKKEDIKSLKIIDFGLTKTLGYDEKTNEALGTITYLAPEVFTHKPYNHKVDIWSIGIILYFLLSGSLPFDDEKLDENIIGKKVVFTQHEYPKEFFGNRSNACLKLIDKCLEKNPEKRICINDLLKDEWICRESK